MPTDPHHDAPRLLFLCRRLLHHNEQLHDRIDHLHKQLRWLGEEYLSLRAEFDRTEQAHAVKEETSDIFLGAALDELSGKASGT